MRICDENDDFNFHRVSKSELATLKNKFPEIMQQIRPCLWASFVMGIWIVFIVEY